VRQSEEERAGLLVQAQAKACEAALVVGELETVRALHEKELVPTSRLTALGRDLTRLEGDRGRLLAAVAQVGGRIAETRLQILGLDQARRSEAADEIRAIEGEIAGLLERRVAARATLDRIDIRAPASGIVHALAVRGVGAVVAPGATLLEIVPEDGPLAVEVTIAPQDIDQLRPGQTAFLRFSAFDQRTTSQGRDPAAMFRQARPSGTRWSVSPGHRSRLLRRRHRGRRASKTGFAACGGRVGPGALHPVCYATRRGIRWRSRRSSGSSRQALGSETRIRVFISTTRAAVLTTRRRRPSNWRRRTASGAARKAQISRQASAWR